MTDDFCDMGLQVSAQHKWSKLNSTLTTLPGRRSDSVMYPPSVMFHLAIFKDCCGTFSSPFLCAYKGLSNAQWSVVVSDDATMKGYWS